MKRIFKLTHLNNFTSITNQTIQDKDLTWEATGLLTYLLSLPEDWDINVVDLANRKKTSKYEVRKIIKELISKGYMVTKTERDVRGYIRKVDYTVTEQSLFNN